MVEAGDGISGCLLISLLSHRGFGIFSSSTATIRIFFCASSCFSSRFSSGFSSRFFSCFSSCLVSTVVSAEGLISISVLLTI